MKKIYTTLLFVFALATVANAQFFSTDFTEASYDDAGVQTLLDGHPDWLSEAAWRSNANDQILLDNANWRKVILDKPITAANGDFVSAKFNLVVGRDTDQILGDGNKVWFGFKNGNSLGDFADREGTIMQHFGGDLFWSSQSSNGGAAGGAGGANGSGLFDIDPEVLGAAVDTPYLVEIEIAFGADAANSSLSARVAGGPIGTVMGIDPELYAAFGSGNGYFWSWGYGWRVVGPPDFSAVFLNDLTVDVTSSTTLSTNNPKNAFEFGLFPNPVKNELRIQTQETIKRVEVLDLLGRQVLSRENINEFLDVSSLNDGLFIVRLTSDKGTSTKKFVKE